MGIVVFSMFSIHISRALEQMAETYYEIEPISEEEQIENTELAENLSSATDKAFNEDTEFKELMKNFKSVQSNDFERTTKAIEEAKSETSEEDSEFSTNTSYTNNNAYALKQSETESYERLKSKLEKRKNNLNTVDEHSNTRGSLTYSLKGRSLVSYNTPRYLCERSGKIVVSIRVNRKGEVYEAFINGSSNSEDQCLIDHAIEYANSVLFDPSSKTDQLGTITFYFKGKN